MKQNNMQLLFAITLFCVAYNAQALIKDISSLQEINAHITHHDQNLLIIFDIDNTLAAPHKELGSDEWFFHHITKKQLANQHDESYTITRAIDEILPLYYAIQHTVPLHPLEQETPALIKKLQKKYHVIALTSRGVKLAARTMHQLHAININFDLVHEEHCCPHETSKKDVSTPGYPESIHWHNIIFCNGHHKGKTLLNYLTQINFKPTKIIFIDDKLKYLVDVEKAVTPLGIEFVGLRYNACDARLDKFNHTAAAEQLETFLLEHGHAH